MDSLWEWIGTIVPGWFCFVLSKEALGSGVLGGRLRMNEYILAIALDSIARGTIVTKSLTFFLGAATFLLVVLATYFTAYLCLIVRLKIPPSSPFLNSLSKTSSL